MEEVTCLAHLDQTRERLGGPDHHDENRICPAKKSHPHQQDAPILDTRKGLLVRRVPNGDVMPG